MKKTILVLLALLIVVSFAACGAREHTVTFNVGDNGNAVESVKEMTDKEITLPSATPKDETKFSFAGWSKTSGGAVDYAGGGKYTVTKDVTLYAVWTVAKTNQTAPQLAIAGQTDTTITVKAVNGAEYSKDNGATWQDSNVFTGLAKNTSYQVTSRLKETAEKNASANAEAMNVKTHYYYADVTSSYEDVFSILTNNSGEIIQKNDGILITGDGFTKFGGYSSEWKGGHTTGVEVYLDPAAFETNEYFMWTNALNNTEGTYKLERHVYFKKTSTDLKIGTGYDDTNILGTDVSGATLATNHENADEIKEAGWYTITVKYYADKDNLIFVDFKLIKSDSNTVIHSNSQKVIIAPSGTYYQATTEGLGGNRYGWFSRMGVDAGIKVKNVWLNMNG